MHIEVKQEMWWVQSLIKVFIKHKYDMHVPTVIQKIYRVFGSLNYQNQDLEDNFFDEFFKGGK